MRPVAEKYPRTQGFASMPTAGVIGNISAPTDTVEYWVGRYGNYQPYGHGGEDIGCPAGTPVYAMRSGTVLYAGWGTDLPGDDSWGPSGYFARWALYKGFPGIVSVIQHPGWIGVYAHLSSNDAAPAGTVVAEGQLIGYSGNTGGVDDHLHVEALVDLSYTTGYGLIYGRTDPAPYYAGGAIVPAGDIIPQPAADLHVSKEDKVILAKSPDSAQVWRGNGMERWPVWSMDTLNNILFWANAGAIDVWKDPKTGSFIQTVPDLNSIGIDQTAIHGLNFEGKGPNNK